MHPWSPSDLSRTSTAEAKLRCVYSILEPHGQSSRCKVRLLPPRKNFKTTCSKFHHLPRVSQKQLCALADLGCTRAAGTSQLMYIMITLGYHWAWLQNTSYLGNMILLVFWMRKIMNELGEKNILSGVLRDIQTFKHV